MSPTVILIVQALLQYGPGVVREIIALAHVENPTPEQWEKVFASAEKTYEDYTKPKA